MSTTRLRRPPPTAVTVPRVVRPTAGMPIRRDALERSAPQRRGAKGTGFGGRMSDVMIQPGTRRRGMAGQILLRRGAAMLWDTVAWLLAITIVVGTQIGRASCRARG